MAIKYGVCTVHARSLRQEHRNRIIVFNTNIILNSVRQHNHFITQGNYKFTCFDYCSVICRPILSIVSQDAMHTLRSHRAYIHGIHPRWDPELCLAYCDRIDKIGLRMTEQ